MIKSVTTHIMPKKALEKQKLDMRRFLKKPLDMKVKDFLEEVVTIYELLNRFPVASPTVPTGKILDNKILDLLESAMANSWKHHMVLQRFYPMDGTIVEQVDFCKRNESTKELPVVKKKVTRRLENTTTREARKDPRNSCPKRRVQALTNACFMDQTKTITQRTDTPS